ncbi:MAG: Uncharacterized protein G01um101425_333 [Candidatus Peregrinibacteria bacterium Gr01-1014_25]|nr:MAG: Uncharacterized protein G01um101425_333 [Candidatus Peregrinibacteria bacterium Gr01-1014_25]
MTIDPFLMLGLIGMVCILWAYIAVQRHQWTQDDFAYDAVNFVGSALLVASAVATYAWPFAILNTIWGALSLRDLLWKDRVPGRWFKPHRRH